MEKRLPLALFLSLIVLFVWMKLNPPSEAPPEAGPESSASRDDTGVESGVAPSVAGDETPAMPNAAPSAAPVTPALVPDVADTEERRHEMIFGRPGEPGYYRAIVSNRGARLESLFLGDYFRRAGLNEEQRTEHDNWMPLLEPVPTIDGVTGSLLLDVSPSSRALAPGGLSDVLWRMQPLDGDAPGVEFTYGAGTGVVFTKRIRSVPGTWRLSLEIEIENRSAGVAGRRDFSFTPAGCVPAELGDKFYQEPSAVAVALDGDEYEYEFESIAAARAEAAGETLDVPTPLAFVGQQGKYFAFLVRGDSAADVRTLTAARAYSVTAEPPVLDDAGKPEPFVGVRVPLALELPAEGASVTYRYLAYAGPKDRDILVGDFEPHAALVEDDLGFFAGISSLLLKVLAMFHRLTGNWGVSIILLTICVRSALFPINRRSQTAMMRYQKKMKRVQPRLDEVKKKHAGDAQKLREAQAKIMQEEGAYPPLGGCLPIFLQLPVFFGLFSALRTSFDLRQEPFFGWITDLSRPDRLLELDMTVPMLFFDFDLRYLNILPILMVVVWIVQQAGMPKPSDEQQARMQKMMLFMPVLFGFMLYSYAAGLSLYMVTQSGLGIIEQRVIKKIWPIDDTEPEKKKKAGCGPFSGMMQNIAEKQRQQVKAMEVAKAQRPAKRKKKR